MHMRRVLPRSAIQHATMETQHKANQGASRRFAASPARHLYMSANSKARLYTGRLQRIPCLVVRCHLLPRHVLEAVGVASGLIGIGMAGADLAPSTAWRGRPASETHLSGALPPTSTTRCGGLHPNEGVLPLRVGELGSPQPFPCDLSVAPRGPSPSWAEACQSRWKLVEDGICSCSAKVRPNLVSPKPMVSPKRRRVASTPQRSPQPVDSSRRRSPCGG